MALSSTTVQVSAASHVIITNTDTDETEDLAYSGSKQLQQVRIANSNVSSVFLQLWNLNDVANVTMGTTEPHMVLPCPAETTQTYVIPAGIVFATGIVMGCTTNLAAPTYTPGAPSVAVTVDLLLG
tara:strand:+ start:2307 stop:2684 length:378 start_codon:yes stop_codon:yes gene_type:complete